MSATDPLETLRVEHPYLAARLEMAEDVCRMYGWSAGMPKTDREKAAFVLWGRWLNMVGGTTSPATMRT